MFFWNRRRKQQEASAAEQAEQDATAAQAAEQLRLGQILFDALKPLAERNTQVQGGLISAGFFKENAGRYSVAITYRSGDHWETMMQFSIDLARNRLTTGTKYNNGPEFTADQFDLFLETASTMVRDFK